MPRKQVYFSTYLRPDLYARLKETSATTHVPMSELIRQALDMLFDRRDRLAVIVARAAKRRGEGG
jgi:hypothetical protein